MSRLLIVLAKHRSESDANHWVVHRFSLPDGALINYDSYPERCLPDGRLLGWWFAIRIAWPNAIYPSPDHLMLHAEDGMPAQADATRGRQFGRSGRDMAQLAHGLTGRTQS
ncbi:hypothetical protein EI94DRAFT_1734641 [Lactarius quietus]|nr:hypothetical protein EI94DRAFT_1734641 [Lactarius quietus]